jgi:hypothetical protein
MSCSGSFHRKDNLQQLFFHRKDNLQQLKELKAAPYEQEVIRSCCWKLVACFANLIKIKSTHLLPIFYLYFFCRSCRGTKKKMDRK